MEQKFISLFDIIGPAIIGPSSSHTAGAAKIGYESYKILGETPQLIHITLYNSFSDTGKGHKTDRAIVGGCMGFLPSDERIKQSLELAQDEHITVRIDWNRYERKYHPNTAEVTLVKDNREIHVIGYSIGGGRVEIASIEEKNTSTSKATILKPFKPYTGGLTNPLTYYSFDQIKDITRIPGDIITLIEETEVQAFDIEHKQFWNQVAELWAVMKSAVENSINNTKLSESHLTGGDAHRLLKMPPRILNQFTHDCLMYSIGIAEHNAKMGRVVACPTAGSCGIVPGILFGFQQHHQLTDKQIQKSLVIAGMIGLVTARQVELAGAVAGCQPEIGVAGAMAAAAGTYLAGGNIDQIESAASLVLGNLLGLTCDPVLGLVEVPCVSRNGAVVSMAVGATEMALSGILYKIPFDEVVSVMKDVGRSMDIKYRETSLGGLAKTPTICKLCAKCG